MAWPGLSQTDWTLGLSEATHLLHIYCSMCNQLKKPSTHTHSERDLLHGSTRPIIIIPNYNKPSATPTPCVLCLEEPSKGHLCEGWRVARTRLQKLQMTLKIPSEEGNLEGVVNDAAGGTQGRSSYLEDVFIGGAAVGEVGHVGDDSVLLHRHRPHGHHHLLARQHGRVQDLRVLAGQKANA